MSIFQFAFTTTESQGFAYVGFPPALSMQSETVQRLLRSALGEAAIGKIRVVAEDVVGHIDRTHASPLSNPAQWPLILYCRGGIKRVGPVRMEWIHDFVTRGFIVLAPCYRGAEGGTGRDEFGGEENTDVIHLLTSLLVDPLIDPSIIAAVGFSRGAINAAQTAVQVSTVNRLVLWGGVSSLAATYRERPHLRRMLHGIIGGSPNEVPRGYDARSPIRLTQSFSSPLLLVHGTKDTQVDVSHTLLLYADRNSRHLPVHTHLYDGLGHHLPYLIHQAVIDRMTEWIRTPVSR